MKCSVMSTSDLSVCAAVCVSTACVRMGSGVIRRSSEETDDPSVSSGSGLACREDSSCGRE